MTIEERLDRAVVHHTFLAEFARRKVLPAFSAEAFEARGKRRLVARARRALYSPRSAWRDSNSQSHRVRLSPTEYGFIPAYRQFIIDNGLDPDRIARKLGVDNFAELLPLADKANYSTCYPPVDRYARGRSGGVVLVQSSGTTGEPVVYCNTVEDLEVSVVQSELHLLSLGLGEAPFWINIAFAFGAWPAARVLAESVRIIMAKTDLFGRPRYDLSLSTPGANIGLAAGILAANLSHISRDRDDLRVVLPGYPPSLKAILEEAKALIDLSRYKIYLIPSGEGYSVPWQMYVAENLLGLDLREGRNLDRIRGFYGAVDLGGSAATETPLTCLVRLLAWDDGALCRDLFSTGEVPTLVQPIPSLFYPEVVNGEAVVTTSSAIRYNIHDRAVIVDYELAIEILHSHGYDVLAMLQKRGYAAWEVWRAPLLAILGRSDGAVSFGGALIYPHSISAALSHQKLAPTNTGNFKVGVIFDSEQNLAGLKLVVELKQQVEPTSLLTQQYAQIILTGLLERSSEFADSFENQLVAKVGRGGEPRLLFVELCRAGTQEFEQRGIKYRYT